MSADVLWDRGGVAGLRLGGAPFFRVRRAPASDVEPLNGHDAPGGSTSREDSPIYSGTAGRWATGPRWLRSRDRRLADWAVNPGHRQRAKTIPRDWDRGPSAPA